MPGSLTETLLRACMMPRDRRLLWITLPISFLEQRMLFAMNLLLQLMM